MAKRSVTIAGHRTSISLEDEFWEALQAIAAERQLSLAGLIGEIDGQRGENNLSASLRVYALNWFRRGAG